MSDYKYLKYKNKYNNLKHSLKNNTYNMVNKKYINNSEKILSLNMVGGTFEEDLARLRSNDSTLTSLKLGHIPDFRQFAEALINNTTLEILNLSKNKVGEYHTYHLIARVLRENITLKNLDLSGNEIGDYGVTEIARALRHNTTLTKLDLRNNYIGLAGAQVIAEVLRENITLRNLNLRNNIIGDIGIKTIANALRYNTNITELDLSFNAIGPVGTGAIVDVLENNFTIQKFDAGWIHEEIYRYYIERYLEENRYMKEILTRVKQMIYGMRGKGQLPPEILHKIIFDNFELPPRGQKYFDFLESQPCPCGRSEYCGGDGLISCFIKGSYNEERSSGTVPAASENVD